MAQTGGVRDVAAARRIVTQPEHPMGSIQRIAQLFGVIFLLVGLLGLFSTGGMSMSVSPPGMILGLFPMNLLHNIVHLLFGVWGLVASRSFGGAKQYATIGGVIYLVLAICGYFIPTTFGLIPIGGNDIWLHAILGIVLVGAGATAKPATAGA
jgi:hypothetical protein